MSIVESSAEVNFKANLFQTLKIYITDNPNTADDLQVEMGCTLEEMYDIYGGKIHKFTIYRLSEIVGATLQNISKKYALS